MSPLIVVLWIAGAACVFAWTASLLSGDTSWVDRLWSVLPETYAWVFAGYGGLSNVRLDVMAILATLWGARLTFNFARKGGYRGVEDYRWAVLRGRMSPLKFQIFNLFFVVLYQNALLVLIALPALSAFQHRTNPAGPADVVVALAFLACLAGETIADQQQWSFHAWKRAESQAGRRANPRFLQTGLFRYSRHPNYFFEIAQWWLFFAFAICASRSPFQLSAVGAILLTVLFIGSTRFTEEISLSKYPEYSSYQATTSPIVPWRGSTKVVRNTDELTYEG
ncbi:MAG: DUF1295 domain-containing protein [Acidimicrobiaceae bacterium]|nr:DUF1295 domain-containing protein [Acidimicrobiaceae bacterium]